VSDTLIGLFIVNLHDVYLLFTVRFVTLVSVQVFLLKTRFQQPVTNLQAIIIMLKPISANGSYIPKSSNINFLETAIIALNCTNLA